MGTKSVVRKWFWLPSGACALMVTAYLAGIILNLKPLDRNEGSPQAPEEPAVEEKDVEDKKEEDKQEQEGEEQEEKEEEKKEETAAEEAATPPPPPPAAPPPPPASEPTPEEEPKAQDENKKDEVKNDSDQGEWEDEIHNVPLLEYIKYKTNELTKNGKYWTEQYNKGLWETWSLKTTTNSLLGAIKRYIENEKKKTSQAKS